MLRQDIFSGVFSNAICWDKKCLVEYFPMQEIFSEVFAGAGNIKLSICLDKKCSVEYILEQEIFVGVFSNV